jgi:anti-sigma B factor antagonist
MQLPSEIFGEVIVVHAPEELTGDNANGFAKCVEQLIRNQVVLDLDGNEMIDSEGLETLLDLRDGLAEVNGDLRVATSNTTNRKLLEITRLDQELEVFGSVIDAVKSYR